MESIFLGQCQSFDRQYTEHVCIFLSNVSLKRSSIQNKEVEVSSAMTQSVAKGYTFEIISTH